MILNLAYHVFLYTGYFAVFVAFGVLSNANYRMLWGSSFSIGWLFPPGAGSAWGEDSDAQSGILARFAAKWRKHGVLWKVSRANLFALILFSLAAICVAVDRGLAAWSDRLPSIPAAEIPFWPDQPDPPA